MKHKNFILIISSPSGAGKTTLSKALLKNDKGIKMSVSCTTRNIRKNEIDGEDYLFLSVEKFKEKARQGLFLEHAEVFGNLYGTLRKPVDEMLSDGKDVLFDIDWQGTHQLKTIIPEKIVSIFILPPSIEELSKRLRDRGRDSQKDIELRLNKAIEEISHYTEYDYLVVNKDVDECLNSIKSIYEVEKNKRRKIKDLAQNIVSNHY